MCLFALPPQPSSPCKYKCLALASLGVRLLKFSRETSKLVFLLRAGPRTGFTHSECVWVLISHYGEPGTCLQFPVESRFILENESGVHVLHTCLKSSLEGNQGKNPPVGDISDVCTSGMKRKSHTVAKLCMEDAVRMCSWILEHAWPGRALYYSKIQ